MIQRVLKWQRQHLRNRLEVYVKAQPEKADAAPHEMEDNTRLLAMLCKGAECAME